MASLLDLKRSISQMTDEDAMGLIIDRRKERGIAKTHRRKKSKKLAKQTLNPSQLVAAMTQSQRDKLRADLLRE